ncbi:beta-1,6-N-acetylglucosaminyltransferase [Lactobacillus johnsonii]|uniref:beta-1,6-N-acetylglucosaminyltransferase n=1 Tax=Lactobacillus johnsonii TaxID=33959 RepID=UPI0028FC1397|nr:beta-1,6-N-acetylglucosaminyltransferase [Lactobacillus johnsonii]WNW29144.1 beta-1,6-N-acetylglucosaminyltransferase [Lactobacillus johnsonii]
MQAILITAYKDKIQLQRLINFFSDDNIVLIHIDKKSDIKINDLKKNPNVKIIKKYDIRWGGLNHLLAILDLLKLSLTFKNINYIHIISGQDIPVKPLKDFKIFNNCELIYLQCESILTKPEAFKNRYRKGCLFSNKDNRKIIWRGANKLYNVFHSPHKRISQFSEKDIYIGLVWSSFPVQVAEYIINYIDKINLLKEWNHVIIPEEFFFQTILYNSKFQKNIVNKNLRYYDWHFRNGSDPAYLDKSDISKIDEGDYFFARKIDTSISKDVIEKYL